jgi:hypothetical protein
MDIEETEVQKTYGIPCRRDAMDSGHPTCCMLNREGTFLSSASKASVLLARTSISCLTMTRVLRVFGFSLAATIALNTSA